MKIRIIGFIIVVAVLGALFIATGGEQTASPAVQSQQPQPASSSDADFKSLKIN